MEFDGKKFPDRVQLPEYENALHLNGIGMRTKFVFSVYVGALYLEKNAKTTKEVLAQEGAKRVLMHFVYDEVSSEKLVAAWNDGFEDNLTEEQLKDLQDRINTFNSMFVTAVKDDVVLLDYYPGKGTKVTVKGQQKGMIPGLAPPHSKIGLVQVNFSGNLIQPGYMLLILLRTKILV